MSGVYDFSSGFNSINNAINNLDRSLKERRQQQTLGNIGAQIAGGDYSGAAQKMLTLGDINSGLKLLEYGQTQGQAANATSAFNSAIMPAGSGAAIPAAMPAVNTGKGNDIEGRFMTGIRNAGLNSPFGLGAVAAYGRAESGFSPRNANRIWADSSESGQPGMSGGIMSWRGDRLRNLYQFAAQRGEMQGNITPETQAAFLASEDPQLIPRLNAARTPEEAHRIMADSWRFAGYNRQGGENARRLAMTQRYASSFGGSPEADLPASGAQPAQGHFMPGEGQQPAQGRGFDTASAQRRIAHLQSVLGQPGLSDGQRQAVKSELDQVMRTSDPLYQAQLARAVEPESPADVRSLQWRAREAGLRPGTQEYQAFIAHGGRSSEEGAAGQKIARLTENILSTGTTNDPNEARNLAVGIADGRLKASRHPITGELLVVDMATGRPISAGQGAAQITAQAEGMPQAQADAPAIPAAGTDRFGQQFPASSESFGIGGTLARGANLATDAIGASPAFPAIQNTQADFAVLQEALLNDISQSYGRQPPSWLLQRIDTLTPRAGTPLEGLGSAQSKLTALGRSFEGERRAVDRALKRELAPQNRQQLEARRAGLDQAIDRVNGALSSFDQPQQTQPANAATPIEGTIIVSDDGRRMILRGNKWETAQ